MESLGEFEYSLGDVLGHGSYAMVFRGRRKRDALQVAIKKISLKSVPGKLSSIRQEEISILKDLKNPHIVQLHDYLNLGSDIFLVMEFCNGGDMGDYLNAKKTLSENSIRHLFQHIALALEALYKLKIIHRDIKPQNLLLSYPVSSLSHSSSSTTSSAMASHTASITSSINKQRPLTDATIKLADFGFARHLYGTDMAATLCGSPLYMAPEILIGQKYEHSADLWSAGVILYQCLSGSAPFMASDPHALRKRYKKESLVPKIPPGTSHYLADLLLKLLKKNSKDRLSFYDFFNHSFLKDPSTLFSADSMISQHTKSSPVPIQRKTHPASSTYSNSPSPKQSASPHHSSSADTSHFSSPSYSSGPPLSHRIGSQTSLQYYNAQSPNSYSDITDQGFILVDFPGNSASRRCSVTSSEGQSSGRNSSAGHTHPGSHAVSSAGIGGGGGVGGNSSLSRYSSLTTPFYQASSSVTRTHQQQQPQQQQALKVASSLTPKNGSSPHEAFLAQSPDSIRTLMARPSPSNAVPFGRLIKYSSNSPRSNVSSTYGSNPPTSLLSTPPSSMNSPTAGYMGVGSKGAAIARRNSGTKLSSLTEEKGQPYGSQANRNGKKDCSTEKTNSGGFDIITKSCLLDSEDEIENISATDEDNFPAGLNMSFTEFEEEEQVTHECVGGVALQGQPYHYRTGQPSPGLQQMPLPPLPADPPQTAPGLVSRRGRPCSSGAVPIRPRRAASFSSGCDLRHDSMSHCKASSLTSGTEDPRLRGFSENVAFPPHQVDEEIVSMRVPFAPSAQSSSTSHPRQYSNTRNTMNADSHKRPNLPSAPPGGGGVQSGGDGGLPRSDRDASIRLGSLSLAEVRDDLELAEELQAMAKARQGPILLMSTSTSLSDSGVVGRFQRCSEQLVLYGKVLSVLESLSTRYGLEVALAQEEPPRVLVSMMDKVAILKVACLDSAKDIQDELLSAKGNGHNLKVRVSAEKLLYLEALDMGKVALLDEESGDQPQNSIRRYRRAALILRHLFSEAHTHHDKQILSKYMHSTEARLRYLQEQLASL